MAVNTGKSLRTEEFTINMGPQHPSTHGVYRAVITLDGEYVVKLENVIGYLHRGIEKMAENRTIMQFLPYTARMDYVSGLLYNIGFAQTVEKLTGIEAPERAEYIRVIMAELQRIASHLVFVGSFAIDLASQTGWLYCFRDREKILDLFEMVCGARLTTNYARFGGVAGDLPEEFIPSLRRVLPDLEKGLEEFDALMTGNEIFLARVKGIGKLDVQKALGYGVTGPNLRASGLQLDLRKAKPYGIYDRFDFEIPVGQNGDTFDRYLMRILEMRQSISIIKQAMRDLPEGPVQTKVPKAIRIEGEVYHQIESSRGVLGFYLVGNGQKEPYRLHVHGPSFVNLGVFPEMVKGGTLQDTIATLASIDILLGEVDR